MDLLKQMAKWLALVLAVSIGMLALGIKPDSAKFGVISALVSFGATFIFFYDRMDFIGIMNSLGTPGLDLNNSPVGVVWKFLGWVFLVIALICLIVW